YAERFGQYGGQTLTIGKVTTRPNGVTMVDSRLNQSNGQPIKIEWEVRDAGGAPRITDVKIEGVSMVITRRTDFTSYIQNNGGKVEALIQELEARATRQKGSAMDSAAKPSDRRSVDRVGTTIREAAQAAAPSEPVLAGMLHATITSQGRFEGALSYHLARLAGTTEVPAALIRQIFEEA